MKLESINFWFIVLCVSVLFHICLPNCGFGNMLYSPGPLNFFLWTMKSSFGTLRKKKVFWYKYFGLLGIESGHGQPDSPIAHSPTPDLT